MEWRVVDGCTSMLVTAISFLRNAFADSIKTTMMHVPVKSPEQLPRGALDMITWKIHRAVDVKQAMDGSSLKALNTELEKDGNDLLLPSFSNSVFRTFKLASSLP